MSNLQKVVELNTKAQAFEAEMESFLVLGDTILNPEEVKAGMRKQTGFGKAIEAKKSAIDCRLLAKKISLRREERED